MELRIGFWNARGRRPGLLDAAGRIVRGLFEEHGLDVLALVEVEAGRIPGADSGRTVTDITHSVGRGRWDAALLLDSQTVALVEWTPVVKPWDTRRLRIAVDIQLEVHRHIPLRLVVSHWPTPAGGAVAYEKYVRGLHESVAPRGAPEQATVLVGDYNLEPFDAGWRGLDTTRDRALASQRPNLFYNLAWRWLGTWTGTGVAGTHRYKQDPHSHWRTYDHVLVSTHLLREGPLRLLDGRVIEEAGGADVLASGFDHLPVVAAFEARDTAGEEARDG